MLLWQFCSIIKADVILSGYATLSQTGKCGKIKQPEFICTEEAFLSGPRNILVSTCVCVNLMCRSGCPTSCLQQCRVAELVDHKSLIYFCPQLLFTVKQGNMTLLVFKKSIGYSNNTVLSTCCYWSALYENRLSSWGCTFSAWYCKSLLDYFFGHCGQI